ncbi:MAG: ABC transporter six-transmembrane domain-containing protein [Kangiellaceae bacterium]|nr:ABC transporter six-transmembrane domain-containing protein [Kangiellaceae bacterium]MCW9000358.1 ABC transporter six-transmembrane domain-containing protein [Kangiellaceae bacterium]
MKQISLRTIFSRFKWRISLTMLLVSAESFLGLLYPLLIGLAINDLIDQNYTGLYYLVYLGIAELIIGSARRFYDTRIYSGIYKEIVVELVDKEYAKNSTVSKTSARTSLLNEFIEFMENSMPEIVSVVIGIIGTLGIIFALNINVFFACLGMLVLVLGTYAASGQLNLNFNKGFNDQLEKQVEHLESRNRLSITNHYEQLMKWNIKLSDLETVNYFVIWLGIIALFAYTPLTVVESGVVKYGMVFAIFMYVFDYIERLVTTPLFIQQLIRLKEISDRFDN